MATARNDNVTELAQRLERAILSGELSPGDRLPSERDISTREGVSRSVVREALGRLASLGLVRSQHGSGTRVEEPSSRPVRLGIQRLLSRPDFRLTHLTEVRLPLETAIAALAAHKRTDADLAALERTQTVLGSPKRTLEVYMRADLDFHALLADATGNPLFGTMLAPMQELLMESRRRTLGRYGTDLAFRHHTRILEAVRAHDAADAIAAMREHIEATFQHLNKG